MKTYFTVTLICLTAVLCLVPADAKDLEQQFLGIRWGQEISSLNGLTKLYAKDNVAYYINPKEVHTLNDVRIPDVVYGFYKNKFFAVYIGVGTIALFADMRRYLTTEYGLPDRSISTKTGQTIYKWKYRGIKIKLKVREKDNRMKLAFYYTPLSGALNEEQLEAYHDRSNTLFPVEKDKSPEMIPLLKF